ncbi:glutathione S-transferase [Acrasis kona]|uniref:Glutathione S-transferase n=1 Tax=Acrasis kona TaxID=1008807 RepID=A0AAW2ZBR5_9EUKA
MSSITLYWSSISPYACRPSIYLYEKGIEFKSNILDFTKQEQKSEEFLKINPRGKVPVLLDEEDGQPITISESAAIMTYLEDKFGPLGPSISSSPRLRAKVLTRAFEIENYLLPMAYGLYTAWFGLTEQEKVDLSGQNEKVKAADAAYDNVIEELQKYDELLKDQALYLVGSEFSLADVMLLPLLLMLEHIKLGLKAEPRLVNLVEYIEVNKKRPSIRQGVPGVWNGDVTRFDFSPFVEAHNKRKSN